MGTYFTNEKSLTDAGLLLMTASYRRRPQTNDDLWLMTTSSWWRHLTDDDLRLITAYDQWKYKAGDVIWLMTTFDWCHEGLRLTTSYDWCRLQAASPSQMTSLLFQFPGRTWRMRPSPSPQPWRSSSLQRRLKTFLTQPSDSNSNARNRFHLQKKNNYGLTTTTITNPVKLLSRSSFCYFLQKERWAKFRRRTMECMKTIWSSLQAA